MIDLEWNGGNVADVSKWFGNGGEYRVGSSECGMGWLYKENGEMVRRQVNFNTIADAKADAEKGFNERLKKPMKYGPAMEAATRGCEVRRASWPDGDRLRSDYTRLVRVGVQTNTERVYIPTLNAINADDWIFVLPEPEPELTPLEMMKQLGADIEKVRNIANYLQHCDLLSRSKGYARDQFRILEATETIRAKLIEEMSNR